MRKRPRKRYDYRGMIERGYNYAWREGYSETTPTGSILFPWMTRRECKSEAKRDGYQAVFFRDGHEEA